ncbi:MAG: LysM peptidoglycan-binding domain-containing protein [Anaerolineales bacterium]|nr:LysM peptidoglycan-binding domain-containing protein [Anaerolineales bacterium]
MDKGSTRKMWLYLGGAIISIATLTALVIVVARNPRGLHSLTPSQVGFDETPSAQLSIEYYTTAPGEDLRSVSRKFGISQETVILANLDQFESNPHIRPGMTLVILPIDGGYYRWKLGDTLDRVAEEFRVSPNAILACKANQQCYQLIEDNLSIEPGDFIIIPGGHKQLPWASGEVEYGESMSPRP